MITIIHGTDNVTSRRYFFDLKEKSSDAEIYQGDKITITDLIQILDGGGLFSDIKTIFIENLFGKRKSDSEIKEIIRILNKNSENCDIFIWESKELTKVQTVKLKDAVVKPFKLPNTLFTLLDSIKPKNGNKLVMLFNQTAQEADPEMIFFMIVRQFRLMLAVREAGREQVDELKRMSWQMGKLKSQASLFDIKDLKKLYADLFEIEKAQKTGNLSMPMKQTIDIFLLSI